MNKWVVQLIELMELIWYDTESEVLALLMLSAFQIWKYIWKTKIWIRTKVFSIFVLYLHDVLFFIKSVLALA